MARPLRIEFAGAVYHAMGRGNERRAIYRDDADRELFLSTLGRVVERWRWIVHAYCLMGNHYHLLFETPEPNLSRGMRQLGGEYTQAFNRLHRRAGHLFQGRFKAVVVEKESHLLELCRYMVLNPVRAKGIKVSRPDGWRWSSYRATAGLTARPGFLSTEWILAQFGGSMKASEQAYRRFVANGLGEGRKGDAAGPEVIRGLWIGTEAFGANLVAHLEGKRDVTEFRKAQRRAYRPTLSQLLPPGIRDHQADLVEQVTKAHLESRYSQREIAQHLGVHYMTISRLVRQGEKKCHET